MSIGVIHSNLDSLFEIACLGQDTLEVLTVTLAIDLRTLDHQHEAILLLLLDVVSQNLQSLRGSISQVVTTALTHQRHIALGEESDNIAAAYALQLVEVEQHVVALVLELGNIILILRLEVTVEILCTTTENYVDILSLHKVVEDTLVIAALLDVSVERCGSSVVNVAGNDYTCCIILLLSLLDDRLYACAVGCKTECRVVSLVTSSQCCT